MTEKPLMCFDVKGHIKRKTQDLLNNGASSSGRSFSIHIGMQPFSGIKDFQTKLSLIEHCRDDFKRFSNQHPGLIEVESNAKKPNHKTIIRYSILSVEHSAKLFSLTTHTTKYDKIITESNLHSDLIPLVKERSINDDTIEKNIELFSTLTALYEGDLKQKRTRIVSAQRFLRRDGSKIMDTHIDTAIHMLSGFLNIDTTETESRYLRENHDYVLLSGPVTIHEKTRHIQHGESLYSKLIIDHNTHHYDAVLTIENLACFQEWSENIHDERILALFTGGQCGRELIKVLQSLKANHYLHWGDLDLGGLQIAKTIAEKTKRQWHVIGWDDTTPSQTTDYSTDSRLDNLIQNTNTLFIGPGINHVIRLIRNNQRCEQECISPDKIYEDILTIIAKK